MNTEPYRRLAAASDTKIVLLVLDGLGGLPQSAGGKTELETASTPNLDALAAKSALGLTVPAGLAPASPGDYFDARFDAEEDAIVFRRLPGKESWISVLKACPVSPDDMPRRRRAPARRRKL